MCAPPRRAGVVACRDLRAGATPPPRPGGSTCAGLRRASPTGTDSYWSSARCGGSWRSNRGVRRRAVGWSSGHQTAVLLRSQLSCDASPASLCRMTNRRPSRCGSTGTLMPRELASVVSSPCLEPDCEHRASSVRCFRLRSQRAVSVSPPIRSGERHLPHRRLFSCSTPRRSKTRGSLLPRISWPSFCGTL